MLVLGLQAARGHPSACEGTALAKPSGTGSTALDSMLTQARDEGWE